MLHIPARACIVVLLSLLFAVGCRPPKAVANGSSVEELVADARAEGLAFENPLEISPDMEQDVDAAIGRRGEPRERLRKLIRHLSERNQGFEQVTGVSLPVKQAYREHRGDCMTYAMLFVALSRYLGLDTHFVHASEVLGFHEKGDSLYASSHIAVGYGNNPEDIVVDFDVAWDDWHLASYRKIDDAAAMSLYFNNVAVYAMNEGHVDYAARALAFLVRKRPGLPELHNNLIVAHIYQKQPRAALEVATDAMLLFPNYKPFYTNAIAAAHDINMPGLVRYYENRAKDIAASDPLYLFARGHRFFREGEYQKAAEQFERALSHREESVIILAWLVRAHLSAGHREAALEAFARAQKVAPNDRRVKALPWQYPELRKP